MKDNFDDQSFWEGIIKEVLQKREEIIGNFVKTWLAVNMPDDADYSWIINNCVLCEIHEDNGNITFVMKYSGDSIRKRIISKNRKFKLFDYTFWTGWLFAVLLLAFKLFM